MSFNLPPRVVEWFLPIALASASLVASGYNAYQLNDKVLSNRVTAIETHFTDESKRLDHIQSQLDRLVEWALGHK